MYNNSNPAKQDVFLLNWLILIFILVLTMIIIGGITRITDSGLSMVEWRPILGFLPPLNNEEWERVFDLYKHTPEYTYYNKGMLLSDFKFIFFWEYFHRLWGRIIGIVFIIPFLYLIVTKKIEKSITVRLMVILFFGSLQAFIGWWMVKSGLIDKPDVSQYRLAIHFGNSLLILFLLFWLILDLKNQKSKIKFDLNLIIFLILFITIIAGSLVAGMDAGLMYNTYPLMNDSFFPIDYLSLGILDPFENPGSAQFHHRHLGLISLIAIGIFFVKNLYKKVFLELLFLIVLITIQFLLGVYILLNYVPNLNASLHQIGAVLIFLTMIKIIHTLNIKT
ncbi:COX15/CtaA family protein [Alphaproteobacteria bacterium]|nr:COX15/CtaA family protein [Alphaproteobacteria bacterium]